MALGLPLSAAPHPRSPTAGRVLRRALAATALTAGVLGCATGGGVVTTNPGSVTPNVEPRSPNRSWSDSLLATMSLRDKAAQMVWPQLFADYVPTSSPQWRNISGLVQEQHVGGIIVSVGSPMEMATKLNAMQRMSRVPLLIGADLEGGAGFRARGGYFTPNGINLGGATDFPQQMGIGASRDTSLAYDMGRVTAIEGRALGIHIAFAPVLDVNNNPGNPVIGSRSFGEDPQLVARMGVATVHGIQDNGMVATGKHFPGHGDTQTNSHLGLPIIPVTRARMDSVELVPFRAAIRAGIGAIMTAHIALPQVTGDSLPATLQPKIMTGLLRDELGFHGLLFTDAMDMQGVMAVMGLVEATKRAVAAGADVILMPTDPTASIDAIVAGVQEGRYSAARVDSSARKILEMKQRLGLERGAEVSLEALRQVVGDSANQAAARYAATRAITLVRDSLHTVPILGTGAAPRVLSVSVARRADLGANRDFDAELRRNVRSLRTAYINSEDPSVDVAPILAMADSADVTIVSAYQLAGYDMQKSNAAPSAFVQFMQALERKPTRTVVVSFGDPYLLRSIPEVPAYMIAWGGLSASQWAAARALTGLAPITGKLPITIPGLAPFGTGEERPGAAATPTAGGPTGPR